MKLFFHRAVNNNEYKFKNIEFVFCRLNGYIDLNKQLTHFYIMLEFKKKILTKVSFDLTLFEKELRKAIKWVTPSEVAELKAWCYQQFDDQFKAIFIRVF